MSLVAFPESPEALSPAWVTEHFQSTGVINADNQVTALEIKPVGDVIGVVGEVVRCRITYAEVCDAPATVVIKFAHRLPENRAIGNNTRMYEREVLFFNEIATQLDTPKTHCYFAVSYTHLRAHET